MKQRILAFIYAERFSIVFFVVLCGIFIFLNIRQPRWHQNLTSSPYAAFLKVEKKFQNQLNTPEELRVFFSSQPALARIVFVYAGFFFLLFAAGVSVDVFLILSKKFRGRVFKKQPSGPNLWGLGALLHVVVQGMAFSLLLNLILDMAWHFIPSLKEASETLFHTLLMDAGLAVLILREIHRHGGSWKNLGFDFQGRRAWREAAFGAGGYAAVIPIFVVILIILMAIAQWLSYEPEPHPLVGIFLNEDKRGQWMIGFSIFLACVWGPFFEEFFFRGFCYPALRKTLGPAGGGMMSAGFFAFIHHSEFAFVPILVLGMGLAFLYERRGNLTASVTLHILHNTVFIAYFFIAKEVMTAANK